jgi:hypothetical protein
MSIAFCVARTGRSTGAVSGEIRDGREPKDREGTRPHCAAVHSASCRRGYRIAGRAYRFLAPLAWLCPRELHVRSFFFSERDHKPQNSGCGCTAQRFHTAWATSSLPHRKRGPRKLAPRRDAIRSHATLTAIRCPHSGLEA